MDLEISGRVAVVTGGSMGIGFAIAEELLANGARVVIASRDPGRLRSAAEALLRKHPGGSVASVAADVATPGAADRIVGAAISSFGALDILVNNAGRATPAA